MTDVFVSADWVDAHSDDVVPIDVRDGWEYDGIGHLPGAVSIPFEAFRSEGGDEGMLPGEERWTALLSEAGVAPDDEVVAYDDTHGVFAARFVVTAELYGHPVDRLHVLDGDYSSWARGHRTTTDATERGATEYVADRPTESALVGREDVEAALSESDTVLLDTREPWEYEDGHLPGAVNLDWKALVDTDSRGLKPESELRSILAEHGIDPEKRILLYCNTARRISHTYLVLRHLGYERLAFYEGSLTEWKRAGGPLES